MCQIAFLGSTLDRTKQTGKSGLIFRPGVLLQSAGQRQMLRFTLFGEPMRIGGQKGEWTIWIALVFRKMKGHPPDSLPQRVLRFEPSGQAGGGTFTDHQRAKFLPESLQQLGGEKFPAAHRRRPLDELRKVVMLGRQHRYRPGIDSSCVTKPL